MSLDKQTTKQLKELQKQLPEGYFIVPLTITEGMCNAAVEEIQDSTEEPEDVAVFAIQAAIQAFTKELNEGA